MKRILLFCGLLLATTFSFTAHAQKSGWPVIASKADFSKAVTDFDNFVIAGNTTAALSKIDDINAMISAQMRYGKYKIKDAIDASDAPRIADAKKNIMDKWTIYNDMSNLVGNPTANKSLIDTKLSDFMKVMD